MEPGKLEQDTLPALAELVLQNGNQIGARRPLYAPVTIVGRGTKCDVRLNVDGVEPIHCLILVSPDGILLRDLQSKQGTFVNGSPADQAPLKDGDILTVGPFQFRLEAPNQPIINPTSEDIRDAVRIQTAAIAAQQAAVDEEEIRLHKRTADLQEQEEQLAAHLEERQRQVQLWSDYAKAEREALHAEKLEHEKKVARTEEELAAQRQELVRDQEKVAEERQRINRVYQKVRERWKKQWVAEREKHRAGSDQLGADNTALAERQDAHRDLEAQLTERVLRFNSERERSAQQLNVDREALHKEQEAWRKRRSLELAALNARRTEGDEAQVKMARMRHALLEEKAAWGQQQASLEIELFGLNNRIVHQRMRIQEQEDTIARLEAVLRERQKDADPSVEDSPAPAEAASPVVAESQPGAAVDDLTPRGAELEQLASDLADQRVLLMEQYQRLLEIEEAWQGERAQVATDLEALAQRLAADEQALEERSKQITVAEAMQRDRAAETDALRQATLTEQANLEARTMAFASEQEKELAALRQKDVRLDEQIAQIAELRQHWNEQRSAEVDKLHSELSSLERELKDTHEQRVELFGKSQQLAEEKRMLAEKMLALEQYRQEVFLRAKDPAAQRRIERLRRRWLSENAQVIDGAKVERDSALNALGQLDGCREHLLHLRSELAESAAVLADKQALLATREAELAVREGQLDDELGTLRMHRQAPPREHECMTDEAEALVFDDFELPPLDQAA